MKRRTPTATTLLLAAACSRAALAQEEPPPTSVLVETAESRLAQIDVTVNGPPSVLAALGPADFLVKINFTKIVDFELDRFCGASDAGPPRPAGSAAPSFLFYFDQPHLTLAGRARSLDLARELIERLIHAGSRAMIVSNAESLSIVENFTDDPARLLDGLERLENDRAQWDSFAQNEGDRVASVVEALNEGNDVQRAMSMARRFQIEEISRTDRNLGRFALTLALLGDVLPPKAALYFADAVRANPGDHYMTFFGPAGRSMRDGTSSDSSIGGLSFDRVVNQAAALNVRLYPVHAEGLVVPSEESRLTSEAMGVARSGPSVSSQRFRDAQDALTSMAGETGGAAFLHGVPAAKIAERLEQDLACVFLISFDPGELPRDAPLRAKVELKRSDASIRTRGRIVLQSAQARTTARLLGAFALSPGDDADLGVRASLVPTGYARGRYSALLQVSVPGTNLPTSTWDLGASLVLHDHVEHEISGRLSVTEPGRPLILEREVELKPGVYDIVAVAHETTTDFILSRRLELAWPDPDAQPITCGPIALFQPASGAFLREETPRTSGSRAYEETEPLRADRPTALLDLVCRGRRNKGELTVQRSLVGETTVEFEALAFDLNGERCAQVRDVIPAGTLGPGSYRYELRVLQDGALVQQVEREFVVLPRPRS